MCSELTRQCIKVCVQLAKVLSVTGTPSPSGEHDRQDVCKLNEDRVLQYKVHILCIGTFFSLVLTPSYLQELVETFHQLELHSSQREAEMRDTSESTVCRRPH